MGTPAARKAKDAYVSLLQGLQVRLKLPFCKRMAQSLLVLLKGPIRSVFVYISPMKTISTGRSGISTGRKKRYINWSNVILIGIIIAIIAYIIINDAV